MILEQAIVAYQQTKSLMLQVDNLVYVSEDDLSPSETFELIIENFLLRIALADGDFDRAEMRFLNVIKPEYDIILEHKVALNNILDDWTYLLLAKNKYEDYINYLRLADIMAGTDMFSMPLIGITAIGTPS